MLSNTRDTQSNNSPENSRPKAEYSLMKNDYSFFSKDKRNEDVVKIVETRNLSSESIKKFELKDSDLALIKLIDDELDSIQVKVNELGKIDDSLCARKDKIIICKDDDLENALTSVFKQSISINTFVNRLEKSLTIEVDKLQEGDWYFKNKIVKYITSLCLSASFVKSFCTPTGILITVDLYERDHMLEKLKLEKPIQITYEHAQGGIRFQ